MNQKLNRTRQILAAIVLVAAVGGFAACEKYAYTLPVVDETIPVSFQTDVQPIFTANCISCHNGKNAPDLRDGKSYLSLTNGGYVTAPGETSILYSRMVSADHTSRSTSTEKGLVLNWINQGALNN